ncbi:CLUMA_CG018271, isoform A [Clunio marinus]|uniref:CLUMA_CG018271, isoform A n=1 Tax=Clunio marinus TaxID=568069 RepID=A0A1J1IXQ7_9DIPT|nr:CLUMA_CG018271, isoform A [Clunio marinus]
METMKKTMDLDDIVSGKQAVRNESSEDTQTNLYSCFNPALSLLAPQLLANQTAAAAALMASWPMQLRAQLASSIGMPHHPSFFPGWPMTPPLSHKSGNSPPPPTSPISPSPSHKSEKLRKLNNNYSHTNNNHIVSTTTELLAHKKTTKRERPYTCEICESRFSDSNQLKAHMLIHNGEKPFGCGHCQSKFRRRHHLMSHKCGSTSISDQTSHNSEASDESVDLTKTTSHFQKCHQLLQGMKSATEEPLNLTNEMIPNGKLMNSFIAKFNETKNLTSPMSQQIGFIQTELPEQTEPEDLSMHSPKSPVSMDELEELDDAATLYLKLQHKTKNSKAV